MLRSIFKSGAIGILTDLTNCLRHGDILAYKNGKKRIVEVKTSGSLDARGKRQKDRLDKLVEYLNLGQVDDFDKAGVHSVRMISHSPEVHYLAEINQVISEAYQRGTALLTLEEGLHYLAVTASQDIELRVGSMMSILGNFDSDHYIYRVEKNAFAHLPFYPLTLSIKKPRAIYDFYNGDLLLFVIISLQVIRSKFASLNITVNFDTKGKDLLFELERVDSSQAETNRLMGIGYYGFGKTTYEFLSLDWYLEEIIYSLNHVADLPVAAQRNMLSIFG